MKPSLDWRTVRLGEFLCESRRPGSTGATARKLTVRLYGKGVVGNPDHNGGSEATKYYRREAGQLIYSKLDFLNGAFGIVPPNLDRYESTTDMPAFDILDGADPAWLLAYLTRPAFYQRFKGSAVGSRKARRVNVGEFLAARVKAPPLAEQRAIVRSLRGVDVQVHASQRAIALLEKQKHGIMTRLLVGDDGRTRAMKDLPERWMFGRVAQGVGRIPADWRLVRLTEVAKLESGHTPSRSRPEWWNGTIPWISLGDAENLDVPVLLETKEYITPDGLANSSARLLPAGTVIFSRTANSWGHTTILGRPMATSQDFANYVCGPLIEPRYVVQVFRHMRREWERFREGSTHKTIYMPVFKQLQVLLPLLEEQRRIANVGEAFDLRIAAERAHLDALRELKRGLADALLSGRLRLPPHMIEALAAEAPDVGE